MIVHRVVVCRGTWIIRSSPKSRMRQPKLSLSRLDQWLPRSENVFLNPNIPTRKLLILHGTLQILVGSQHHFKPATPTSEISLNNYLQIWCPKNDHFSKVKCPSKIQRKHFRNMQPDFGDLGEASETGFWWPWRGQQTIWRQRNATAFGVQSFRWFLWSLETLFEKLLSVSFTKIQNINSRAKLQNTDLKGLRHDDGSHYLLDLGLICSELI